MNRSPVRSIDLLRRRSHRLFFPVARDLYDAIRNKGLCSTTIPSAYGGTGKPNTPTGSVAFMAA
jgi:hypothetical protein